MDSNQMVAELAFFSSLMGCIALGSYYKKIKNITMKRNYGAGLGLLVAFLICGHQVYHSVLIVWGNIIIIKCCDKRYIHHLSLAYTWTYLVYLYYNIKGGQHSHWIHQTIALRVVGLAFEVHTSFAENKPDKNDNNESKKSTAEKSTAGLDTGVLINQPTSVDIMTYSYFFIGLHRGPYYRWKIFDEHFRTPFGMLGNCRVITKQKVKKAFICGLGYLLLQTSYSSKIYDNDAFYEIYEDSRLLYNLPQLVMFFFYNQMVMMLCTSVCTEAGFGVYPTECAPVPGHGPTTATSLLNLAMEEQRVALEQEYNFSMLKCFENEKLLLGPKMKDSTRGWDMPTRYWYWAYIYKNALKSTKKEVRNVFTYFIWLLWMGLSVKNFIIALTIGIYSNLESKYSTRFNSSDASIRTSLNIGFSMMRMFCLIYLAPCFILENSSAIIGYYNSMLWSFHILLLILSVVEMMKYMGQGNTSIVNRLVRGSVAFESGE